MSCTDWGPRISAYVDGGLSLSERDAFRVHAQQCAACASEAFILTEEKAALRRAGERYTAPTELRDRLLSSRRPGSPQGDVPSPSKQPDVPSGALTSTHRGAWLWTAAAALIVALGLYFWSARNAQSKSLAEFADLHVMALSSANPLDVVSTDRHTVKPWFQGKIPFAFDLPELAGTPFTLVGGRVAYFRQEPGAQLIFGYQRHLISVFIFRDTPQLGFPFATSSGHSSSFTETTWTQRGLRYIVLGDAGAGTIQQLREVLQRGS